MTRVPRTGTDLSLRIRELRKERGLTLAQLADIIGISTPHFSQVERGKKRINNHLLVRLSEALKVQPFELIALETETTDLMQLRTLYLRLSDEERRIVLAMLDGLVRGHRSKEDRLPDRSVAGIRE